MIGMGADFAYVIGRANTGGSGGITQNKGYGVSPRNHFSVFFQFLSYIKKIISVL